MRTRVTEPLPIGSLRTDPLAVASLRPREELIRFSDETRQPVNTGQPRRALLVADVRIEGPIDRVEDRDGDVDAVKRLVGAIKQRRAALTAKGTDCPGGRPVLGDQGAARDESKSVAWNGRPSDERCSVHAATTLAMAIGGEKRRRGELDVNGVACTMAVERRGHEVQRTASRRGGATSACPSRSCESAAACCSKNRATALAFLTNSRGACGNARSTVQPRPRNLSGVPRSGALSLLRRGATPRRRSRREVLHTE